jgi:hypothetical protein
MTTHSPATPPRRTVVLDGYGTLWGVVRGEQQTLLRPHALTVLRELAQQYDLVLWTTASRAALDRILAQFPGLSECFTALITSETAPTDSHTFLTPQGRGERISKNIRLIGGAVLVDDSDAAQEEGAAFGFPVLRAPSFFGQSAADRAAMEADDWLLRLPGLLAALWEEQARAAAAAEPAAGERP